MFCAECGKENAEGVRFCSCGYDLRPSTPSASDLSLGSGMGNSVGEAGATVVMGVSVGEAGATNVMRNSVGGTGATAVMGDSVGVAGETGTVTYFPARGAQTNSWQWQVRREIGDCLHGRPMSAWPEFGGRPPQSWVRLKSEK